MLVPHDAVYEGLKKLPRAGMWNYHSNMWVFCCPVCKLYSHLNRHAIDAEGRVTPSVVCPHTRTDRTPCTFHEMLTLQGWQTRVGQLPF